jgi:hypothetical protein
MGIEAAHQGDRSRALHEIQLTWVVRRAGSGGYNPNEPQGNVCTAITWTTTV